MKKSKSTRYRLEARKSPIAGRVCSQPRSAKGASAIMELEEGKNIDGFDKGNAAALVCFLLRQKGKVWLVSGIEGIKAGEELTYDYGSDYYPRKRRKRK